MTARCADPAAGGGEAAVGTRRGDSANARVADVDGIDAVTGTGLVGNDGNGGGGGESVATVTGESGPAGEGAIEVGGAVGSVERGAG